MAKKSGLGKGLDALIPTTPEESALPASGVALVAVSQIIPNPEQPRVDFPQDQLQELSDSIRSHGVIQPLVVTHGKHPGEYILIAGERRLQASKLARLQEVPVVIREADNQELLELALIENIQRADLSPLETAEAYRRLEQEYQLTHDEIAARVGFSREAVTNKISLLSQPNAVKEALAQGMIHEGHAKAIRGLSPQAQSAALKTILEKALSVRQTEELARKFKGQKPANPAPKKHLPPEILELQGRLRDSLGTKVSMTRGEKGGTIVLHYYSDEDLNTLLERLLGEL
ncbi:MAG: ParB/RepB/Spo0J family partition protein [Anaerolineae bacterium]|nr:ParB/RepB/Spo0J family partition protein [Anaerolineae bacterium]